MYLNKIVLLCLIASILNLYGCVTTNTYISQKKKNAQIVLEKLKARIPSEPVCWIGYYVDLTNPELFILETSSYARNVGFHEGDHIKAINDESVSSPKEMIDMLDSKRVGDIVQITIDRNGSSRDIKVECRDGRDLYDNFIEAFQYAALGKWDDCISKSYELDNEFGAAPYHAIIRLNCNDARLVQINGRPNLNDAEIAYECRTRLIKFANRSMVRLDKIRRDVIKTISWLESNKFYSYASDLEKKWVSAKTQAQQPNSESDFPEQN